MTLANDLNLTDIDKALALRQFSGGGSGSGTTGPTGPTGPSAGPTGPTGGPGPTGPSGAATNSLVQTNSAIASGPTAITPSGLATICGGPLTVTVPAGGGRICVQASANISGTAAQLVSVAIIVDGTNVMENNVTSSGASAQESPGMVYRSNPLTAGAHTVDLQATTAGGSNMSAANGALVVEVVTV